MGAVPASIINGDVANIAGGLRYLACYQKATKTAK
jgi:hypothetical protein